MRYQCVKGLGYSWCSNVNSCPCLLIIWPLGVSREDNNTCIGGLFRNASSDFDPRVTTPRKHPLTRRRGGQTPHWRLSEIHEPLCTAHNPSYNFTCLCVTVMSCLSPPLSFFLSFPSCPSGPATWPTLGEYLRKQRVSIRPVLFHIIFTRCALLRQSYR